MPRSSIMNPHQLYSFKNNQPHFLRKQFSISRETFEHTISDRVSFYQFQFEINNNPDLGLCFLVKKRLIPFFVRTSKFRLSLVVLNISQI